MLSVIATQQEAANINSNYNLAAQQVIVNINSIYVYTEKQEDNRMFGQIPLSFVF